MHSSSCKCSVCFAAAVAAATFVYLRDKSGLIEAPTGIHSPWGATATSSNFAFSHSAIATMSGEEVKGPPLEVRAKVEYFQPPSEPAELPPKHAWRTPVTPRSPRSTLFWKYFALPSRTSRSSDQSAAPFETLERPQRTASLKLLNAVA